MPNANAILPKSTDLPAIAFVPKTEWVVNGKLRCRIGGIVKHFIARRRERKVLAQPQTMSLHSELERMPSPLMAEAGMKPFGFRAVMQAHEVRCARLVGVEQAPNARAPVRQNLADGGVVEQVGPAQRLRVIAPLLALLLPGILLVLRVRHLVVRAVGREIQVQRVMLGRCKVEARKKLRRSASIVQAFDFGRIKIAPGAVRLRAQKHPDLLVQISADLEIRAAAVERAAEQRERTIPRGVQPRFRIYR